MPHATCNICKHWIRKNKNNIPHENQPYHLLISTGEIQCKGECLKPSCNKTFKKYGSYRSHISRNKKKNQ